jgi:hypothetical protein
MSTLNITAASLIAGNFRPLYAGDSYDYTFTVVDCAGTPISLVGAKVWFTIKADIRQPDNAAHLAYVSTNVVQIELTSPETGVLVVHFQPADTICLDGTWEYDLKVKSAAGEVFHAARGTIEFLTSVTKSYS